MSDQSTQKKKTAAKVDHRGLIQKQLHLGTRTSSLSLEFIVRNCRALDKPHELQPCNVLKKAFIPSFFSALQRAEMLYFSTCINKFASAALEQELKNA